MPYYDFRCAACGAAFELHLAIERRDDASCPHCGSGEVRRAMPAVYTIVREPAAAGRGAGGTAPGGCGCGGACSCGCGG